MLFLLSVMCGVLLVATVQAKSATAPPKQATPSASSAAASAPEQPWLQMEITPLEKEIVKQHLAKSSDSWKARALLWMSSS